MDIFQLKNGFHYAMHGCGYFKGLRQTNSKEALSHWYSKGVRIFEIDIGLTDDEQYIAVAHDLKNDSLKRLELISPPLEKSFSWFMKQKLFGVSTKGLTPLSLERIVNLMLYYDDIIVMFDLFGLFSTEECYRFVSNLGRLIDNSLLWNRILVESYNIQMIRGIKSGSNKANIIHCVRYENNCFDKETISSSDLLKEGIAFVSYPWMYSKKHAGEIDGYSNNGLIVFSRTRFNLNNRKLKKAGVSVNIIANRFNLLLFPFEWIVYLSKYVKRFFVKKYINKHFCAS